MLACVITYDIDPAQTSAFEEYARAWAEIIPQFNGVDFIGYFMPHEGSITTAYGLYYVESLAAYEAYREWLKADPAAQANFAFARKKGFIRREDRSFVRTVDPAAAPA